MKTEASLVYLGGLALALILAFAFSAMGQVKKGKPKYLNPKLPVDQRVDDLIKRMTLEEKVAQLQCEIRETQGKDIFGKEGIGGLGIILRSLAAKEAAEKANLLQKTALEKTRLGIPIIIHDEALHGLIGRDATSFPQAIALASMWNTDLMGRVARVIGKETRSRGIQQALSPVVNIARDARWGRVEETYGEDPYLTSRMGVAFCKGLESEGVITTPKHYAANVGDGGRDSNPIHFSERLLREIYFPAFKACFQEANAGSVMAAYNSLDGLPCSANKWLLTDVLRKEWGFKGFVVSDYGSVGGIRTLHHTAATKEETAKQAIEAGLDMELPVIDIYGAPLLQAVKEGLVSESTIDRSVKRILASKFRLGLFENPYVDPEGAASINNSPEHRALALEAAREAIVLLKNENNLLPLNKDIKSIAVVGPNADVVRLGGYSGWGMKVVTLLEGIKNKVPSATVRLEKGCELGGAPLTPIPATNLIPPDAKPGEQGLKGEYFNNMNLSGKPTLVRVDKQVNFNWGPRSPDSTIQDDQFSVRWTGKIVPPDSGIYKISVTTDDGVRLWIDGKLLVDSWYDRGTTSDLVTMRLEAGRQYDLRVEYYEDQGWAYANLGWDVKADIDKNLQAAVDSAEKSDVAIVAVGIVEGEGRDRANLDLPGSQEELIKAVAATGKPTVVVLMNGSAVTMRNWIDKIPAIVEAWYDGEEGGNAVADVLFGDYNPGGKLPITFPRFVGQVPLYYNPKPTGRGYDYTDMSGKPQFPFGHGSSYTKFEYSNLQVAPQKTNPNGKIQVSVDVQNVGERKGDEVIQLYVHDFVASVTRPLKELKGFKRISLDPKEKKTVTFQLTRAELEYLDERMKYVLEPGTIEVLVGSSSEDIRLKSSFEVVER
jgi:beta-glucosidase